MPRDVPSEAVRAFVRRSIAALHIHGGDRPPAPDSPAAGAPLAVLVMNGPEGIDPSADGGGTATWFRVLDRDGRALADGDVGTDLVLSTILIAAGDMVTVTVTV